MKWPLMGETITLGDRLKMAHFALTAPKFTNGEKVKKFEKEWNEWLGSKHSLYVSSGSTANFLLVAAVKELYGLKNGDKVLLPACTWMTNVAPIMQLGLEPVFCDIGKKHGLNSLGATFSFYFGHHMSTIEGGMISTNNTDLYDLMKLKRSHGMARESLRFDEYAKAYPNIDKQFLFVTDGYNFRNHEICAVLGSSQLKRLDKMISIRNRNHTLFTKIIDKYSNLFYNIKDHPSNSSFCLPFICRSNEIMLAMKEKFIKYGIEYRPVVSGNLLEQPFLANYVIDTDKQRTNADIVHTQGVYVGNNHFVTEEDMKFLEKVVGEINESFR